MYKSQVYNNIYKLSIKKYTVIRYCQYLIHNNITYINSLRFLNLLLIIQQCSLLLLICYGLFGKKYRQFTAQIIIILEIN